MEKEAQELADRLLKNGALVLRDSDNLVSFNPDLMDRLTALRLAEAMWGVVLKNNSCFEAIAGFGLSGKVIIDLMVRFVLAQPYGFAIYQNPGQITKPVELLLFFGEPPPTSELVSFLTFLRWCKKKDITIAGIVAPFWQLGSGPDMPSVYALFEKAELKKYLRL